MMDHYYGAFADLARSGAAQMKQASQQQQGRVLQGEEHAAAVQQLQAQSTFASTGSERLSAGVVVAIGPSLPEPATGPAEAQFLTPKPGVMVRQDSAKLPEHPELSQRISMVEVELDGQPGDLPQGLAPLLELHAKRDLNLGQSLRLLGVYDTEVQQLSEHSRVEMGDIHGLQLFDDQGLVYRSPMHKFYDHYQPEVRFNLQTVDGSRISIQLNVDQMNSTRTSSDHSMQLPRKELARTISLSLTTEGQISEAAREGLAPIMARLDTLINSFHIHQAVRQSDLDAFSEQMANSSPLFQSSELLLQMGARAQADRTISIQTLGSQTLVDVDERAMHDFYGGSFVADLSLDPPREDLEARSRFLADNPQGFYLPAVAEHWSTEYSTWHRFMHSLLEP